MAWWPFGRKRRKQKQKDAEKARSYTAPVTTRPSATSTAPRTPTTSPPAPLLSEKPSNIGQTSPHPPRLPPLRIASRRVSAENITALPLVADQRASSPHLRQTTDSSARTKSLHQSSSRRDFGIARAVSRKSKRESHEREEQIRQMSSPIPIPAPPEDDTLGRLFRRGSKRRRSAIGRDFSQHGSVVSLPATSIRSGTTGMSESNRYEVGAMDVFSARPTIRYSWQPNQPWSPSTGDPRSNAPSRTESRKGKGKEVRPLSRKTLREGKTVDNLVEEYDAHGIRELMERDQRRRDRRRKAQEDQARRRLERAVAKQDEAGSPSTENPFSGLGLAGIEAGPSSPAAMRRPTHPLEREMLEQMREEDGQSRGSDARQATRAPVSDPFADPEDQASTLAFGKTTEQPPVLITEGNEQRYSTVSGSSVMLTPTTLERRKASIPYSNRDLASDDIPGATPPSTTQTDRQGSDAGSRRGGGFGSLFRRSGANQRPSIAEGDDRVAPSQMSFSNTSRESMSRQPIPAHLREQPSASQMRPIGITRTRSKFREDLPEYPMSPPDSRIQSPEAETIPPLPKAMAVPGAKVSGDSERRNLSGTTSPVEAVLSQSIASVDSEGSWLSGRPTPRKRASTLLQAAPATVAEQEESSSPPTTSEPADSNRVGGLSSQTLAGAEVASSSRVAVGTSSDAGRSEDRQTRTDSPYEQGPDDGRYSSSDYGGSQLDLIEESPSKPKTQHARQISSGSARLLDIGPRSPTSRSPDDQTYGSSH